ncbi:MAG TPA: CRTAC1 family protein [Terriglobales bacterium]|nr:CRTAC1 family protein [Terriglobales bacterium]
MNSHSRNSRRFFLGSFGRCGLLLAMRGRFPTLFPLIRPDFESPDPFSTPVAPGSAFDVNLVDIAAQARLNSITVCGEVSHKRWLIETIGSGIAFFDYDQDGWLDIFQVNGTTLAGFPKGEEASNHLYHNNRDGTFTDVTTNAGLFRSGWGQGVCAGDYDNDGYDDLFVSYWGQNVLYHNNGDGTFTDVTEKAGLLQHGPRARWNTGCCFVDYDKDGRLDLFVSNYMDMDLSTIPPAGASSRCAWKGLPVVCGPHNMPWTRNFLYHNNGDGTFTDVSEKSGVLRTAGHYGFTALTGDFDNDGWPDIYVACDSAPSIFYRNNRDGTFADIALMAQCAYNADGREQAGMGASAGDYNCDGWLDIIKTNFSDDTSTLYKNDGDGSFTDVTYIAGMGTNIQYLGWGCGFVDLDNDGWQDVFIANGHIYPELLKENLNTAYRQPKLVYRNLRNGRFEDVSRRAGPGVSLARLARGVAFGDFDNDGDIDMVINNLGDPPTLLRNDVSNSNRWLKVKTVGTRSNRTGIGARVRVVCGKHSQIDEVRSGGSYVSQGDLRLHFGMGSAGKADRVEVRWPSGQVDVLKDIETNQLIWVREGAGILRAERFPAKS